MAIPEKQPTGKGAPAPVAPGTPANVPSNNPPSPSALETATRHGGLSGGKPRKDTLVPGSPEAVAADREKDRIRVANKRAAARAVAAKLNPEPAALPSAVPGAATAPVNSGGPLSPVAPAPAFVPWQPDIIKPLIEDLLEAAEEGRVAQFAAKCKKLGDMPKLVKEIEADAHFPKAAKVLLATSLPRLAAKWLNKSGISAEYQDEVACATAILLIIKHDRSMSMKLDQLIEQTKPKAPDKKNDQTIFAGTQAVSKVGNPEASAAGTPPAPGKALGEPQPIANVRQ